MLIWKKDKVSKKYIKLEQKLQMPYYKIKKMEMRLYAIQIKLMKRKKVSFIKRLLQTKFFIKSILRKRMLIRN